MGDFHGWVPSSTYIYALLLRSASRATGTRLPIYSGNGGDRIHPRTISSEVNLIKLIEWGYVEDRRHFLAVKKDCIFPE